MLSEKTNKGKGTVIFDKYDYVTKMNHILSDHSKFECVGDPTFQTIFRIEDRINRFLKYLKV